MSWLAALVKLAPLLSELTELAIGIARTGADPQETVKRLRKILPDILIAAQTGAMVDTDDEWAAHVRKHFGG